MIAISSTIINKNTFQECVYVERESEKQSFASKWSTLRKKIVWQQQLRCEGNKKKMKDKVVIFFHHLSLGKKRKTMCDESVRRNSVDVCVCVRGKETVGRLAG